MDLFNQLKIDRIQAMKDKDVLKKDLLSAVIGESSKQSKEPSDKFVITTIKRFLSNIDINLGYPQSYESNEKLCNEMVILKSYLYNYVEAKSLLQLSKDDYYTIINDIITVSTDKKLKLDLGVIMKYFKDHYPDRYDGKALSEIAKEMLK